MNDKPNMQEDFVLNGNCTTSTNQELIDQLCPKPTESVALTPPVTQELPRTGGDWLFLSLFLAILIVGMAILRD